MVCDECYNAQGEHIIHFTAYVLRTGLCVNRNPNVLEVMLYNGRKVFVRECGSHFPGINPGELVVFHCGYNEYREIDLETKQENGTYYTVTRNGTHKIEDETMIRTFFIGTQILKPVTTLKTYVQQICAGLKRFFSRRPTLQKAQS